MSLVEKALGKMRGGSAAAEVPATPVVRPAVRPSAARIATDPQLRMTPQILANLGLVAPPDQEHQRASEYRHIKRQVIASIRANPDERAVLVVSALAGDGKSFTSANLARSIALEPDFTVLLIDADVVKPQLSRSMSLMDRRGLMDALIDPACDPESLVLSTDIEGLSVLPAGGASESATEYFSSARMQEVLALLLAVPNRILVIDSLPLLVTTEARVLTPLASQVLLVVRAEATPQSAVEQALALIDEDVDVRLVLNAVVRTPAGRYLGYGYGFDYNYTSRKDARSART